MIRAVDRATVNVYEEHARSRRERRPIVAPDLGAPVVGLDAARAMLELAREAVPDAWLVEADLEALPFRTQSLAGAWARAGYLHVSRGDLPAALADLHHALEVGAPAMFDFGRGDDEGLLASDDFPGGFFAEWEPEPLAEVIAGAGFEVEECAIETAGREWVRVRATRVRTLPDHVGPGMRLLVCGLNPSLYAADAGVGYARPGNRFWPAALRAGLVTRDRDPRHALARHGVGMTDLVKRATTSANELTRAEYRDGARRVERLVRWLRPRAVCFVGLTGWRMALDPKAVVGEQPGDFGGAPAYVMPNTSGINAHASHDDLVQHLRAAAALADQSPAI